MAILNGEAKKETNTETKIESGAEKKEADADEQIDLILDGLN